MDAGYLTPENIADKVQVKGRGGTVLQPGINLLEKAQNFPSSAPLLIITDGYCDRLLIRREHGREANPLGLFYCHLVLACHLYLKEKYLKLNENRFNRNKRAF